ncbi:MAG TPA: glycosyltransferase family 2 protein [Syntrophales bacterium]|nr:glycosyltransferase family 2 protein [Syntrophales bacterium]HPQ43670.1 glycosyltransferase family 2 protein [Syntrophales bacterium]
MKRQPIKKESSVDVSICMVSFNSEKVLADCLESIYASSPSVTREIILVDNDSADGTVNMVRSLFPDVKLIVNNTNIGFSKATNQALQVSRGRYLLWLNCDTIIAHDLLDVMIDFFESHPSAGIVGPKVFNGDGTFQPQCRRGLPTPYAALGYFLGIDRIWPDNKRLSQYLLRYLPEDEAHQVDAVSGCCLMARREVYATIGFIDEDIFGFGEDIEWCVRARKAGWEVWYCPASSVIHLKGEGGVHAAPFRKEFAMHKAMRVFFRKHLSDHYPSYISSIVVTGIIVHLMVALGKTAGRQLLGNRSDRGVTMKEIKRSS